MDGLSVSRGVTAKEPKSSVWKRCPSPGSLPVTQTSTLNPDEPLFIPNLPVKHNPV
jgi:hypothetical protein